MSAEGGDPSITLSREQLSALIHTSPTVMFIFDAQRDFAPIFVSDGVTRQLGWSPRDFMTTPKFWIDNVHPEDRESVLANLDVLRETNSTAHEFRFLHENRAYRWIRCDLWMIPGNDEASKQAVGYWLDITDAKSAEQTLRENAYQLKDFSEAASDWLWETNADHEFAYFFHYPNSIFTDQTSKQIGKTHFQLRLPNDTDDEKWAGHRADLEARRSFKNFEFPILFADGSTRHLRVSGKPFFFTDGQFLGYRGTASEITAEMEARQLARTAQTRFATAIDELSEALLLFDAEDRLVIGNRPWWQLNRNIADQIQPGARFEDILRALIHVGLIPEARGQEEKWLRERLERHRNPKGPFELARPQGRWLLVNDHRLPDGGIITVAIDITNLKKNEQALMESERRFRDFAESASDWFWETDAEHRFTYISPHDDAAVAVLNQRAIGKTRLDLRLPDDRDDEKWKAHCADLDARRPFRYFEYAREGKESTKYYMRASGRPIFSNDGAFLGYRGTSIDITDQVNFEAALRDSEARYKEFAASAGDWLWETDPQLRFTRFEGQASMVSHDPERRALGKTRFDMRMPYDDDDENWAAHRADLDARRPFTAFEFPFDADDGTKHYVRATGWPVFSKDGRFQGYRGTTNDVTKRKLAEQELNKVYEELEQKVEERTGALKRELEQREEAEQELAEKNALLEATFDNISEGFALFDKEDRLVFCNEIYRRRAESLGHLIKPGMRFEELVRENIERGRVAYEGDDVETKFQMRMSQHRDPRSKLEIQINDGDWVLVSERKTSMGGIALVETDITEQKRIEMALRGSETSLRSVLDSVLDGIITIDDKGTVASFSSAARRIFGYEATEIVGHNVRMLMPDPDRRRHDGYLSRYLTTGIARIIGIGRQVTGLRKDGTTFPLELAISEMAVDGTRMFTGVVRDVTEREEAERQYREMEVSLNHSSRLSVMGEMASGLAHELSQPLTAVKTYASTCRDMLIATEERLPPQIVQSLEEVIAEAGRAGDILQNLRRFVHDEEPVLLLDDINEIIREACILASVETKYHGFTLDTQYSPDLPLVLVNKVQIQQVFLNLVHNGIEATDAANPHELTIETSRAGDDAVAVAVHDRGGGFSEELTDRLFEPFFTTKSAGMGIGLSISKKIIEVHGGQIRAMPNPKGGSIFLFTLPLALQDGGNNVE